MKISKVLLIAFIFFLNNLLFGKMVTERKSQTLYAINDTLTFAYQQPDIFQPFKFFYKDFVIFGKNTFNKENILNWSIVGTSTIALLYLDQQILDESQRFGEKIGIDGENRLKTYISAFGYPIFRGPTDLSSSLYYLGDGWFHLSIAASFLTFGLIESDNRALQTASQIGEGLMTTGLATQLLKHITGRESPFVATADAGVWRPFPDQIKYHKRVPHYDAFPSGHLATAMMTFTIIDENYPEYWYIIKPLGYSIMTLLGYQMMNNGVHWISDYPLGIFLGYSFGKIAVERGRNRLVNGKVQNEDKNSWLKNISFSPSVNPITGSFAFKINYNLR